MTLILQWMAQPHDWKGVTHPEGPVPVTGDICHAGCQDITQTAVTNRKE